MLPDRIIDPNRDVRRIITGVCVVVISLGFAFLVSFPLDIAELIYLILLFVSGIGCILLCRLCYPYTVLSHEGVTTRFLFKEKLYYWDERYSVPQPIVGEDRYKYECYHPADGNYPYPGRTQTWLGWINVQSDQWAIGDYMGKKAWQRLEEIVNSNS